MDERGIGIFETYLIELVSENVARSAFATELSSGIWAMYVGIDLSTVLPFVTIPHDRENIPAPNCCNFSFEGKEEEMHIRI
jgi:hypothetical protein